MSALNQLVLQSKPEIRANLVQGVLSEHQVLNFDASAKKVDRFSVEPNGKPALPEFNGHRLYRTSVEIPGDASSEGWLIRGLVFTSANLAPHRE